MTLGRFGPSLYCSPLYKARTSRGWHQNRKKSGTCIIAHQNSCPVVTKTSKTNAPRQAPVVPPEDEDDVPSPAAALLLSDGPPTTSLSLLALFSWSMCACTLAVQSLSRPSVSAPHQETTHQNLSSRPPPTIFAHFSLLKTMQVGI